MIALIALLALAGCKKLSTATPTQTETLNLAGATNRNMTLVVEGLRASRSKGDVHTVCAVGLTGQESMSSEIAKKKLVCASKLNSQGHIELPLQNLPYPAYITIFHDENNNRILDFAVLNLIFIKNTAPAEGVGAIVPKDNSIAFSRPIWVDVGETTLRASLHYDDMPIWKLVKQESWQMFFNWYADMSHKINHPKTEKNPFPPTPKD